MPAWLYTADAGIDTPELRWPTTPATFASANFWAIVGPSFGSAWSSSDMELEADLLAADGQALGVGFLDGEPRAVLVVLAEVGDAARQRAGMAELDGDRLPRRAGPPARLGRFRRLLRFFLAAAVERRQGGGDQRHAKLLVQVHVRGPPETGDGGVGKTLNYRSSCQESQSRRRRPPWASPPPGAGPAYEGARTSSRLAALCHARLVPAGGALKLRALRESGSPPAASNGAGDLPGRPQARGATWEGRRAPRGHRTAPREPHGQGEMHGNSFSPAPCSCRAGVAPLRPRWAPRPPISASKKAERRAQNKKEPVTLAFAPGDLGSSRPAPRPLAPVSGAIQAVRQATVKARVPGEVRMLERPRRRGGQGGAAIARIDTSDLEAGSPSAKARWRAPAPSLRWRRRPAR